MPHEFRSRHHRSIDRGARHSRASRGRARVTKAASMTLAVLVLSATAATATLYVHLNKRLTGADVDAYLGADRPDSDRDLHDGYAGRPLNILVMGTDMRDEDNAELAGDADAMNADTTILLHLSADRTRVDLVSVPRDSLVRIPACTRPDGSVTTPRESAMFNSAFAVGAGGTEDLAAAAACTRLTFEANSGVLTDESVVLKMDGVRDIVDAIGGIPIDLPDAMHSPKAGLSVPAGPQVFDGTTALAFLRARTGTGLGLEVGSDLGRIERQQLFLHAFADHLHDLGVLTNPTTMIRLLTATADSLSLSAGLSDIRALAGLGFALRDAGPEALTPVMVPVAVAPTDRNRVVWTAQAEDLWQRVREDRPLVDPEAPVAQPTD